ncbi:MAG: hypothetical protein JWM76_3541, partial [Pseudonocardiales bacterium]|nr:hypothetical protein [Pseudonocardiales bacterium]
AATPFLVGHRYQLRIGGRAVTTFTAVTVPTAPALSAVTTKKAGAVSLHYRDAKLTGHLAQVWSGPNCSGVLVSQRWTSAAGLNVGGLRSHRMYSARVAGQGSKGVGTRWSGCANFRPA